MNIVSGIVQAVGRTADATTAAAGAVGGAAINGVVGGIKGAGAGVRAGLREGSRSSAAAAITLAAVGTAGLVDWPVLLTLGGATLVLHELNQRTHDGQTQVHTNGQNSQGRRPATNRSNGSARRTAAKSPARRTEAKRATK